MSKINSVNINNKDLVISYINTLPICNINNNNLDGYECSNCIEINTQKLVDLINEEPYKSNRELLFGLDTTDLMKQIGKTKDGTSDITNNSYFSVKELAKIWIVSTDGYTWRPSKESNTIFKGGVPTCAQSIAVASFEGGAQVEPTAITIKGGCNNPVNILPLDRCDPTFDFNFCKNNSCKNGAYWQVSSAVLKNIWNQKVPAVSTVKYSCVGPNLNDFNLKNPFCAAFVSMTWSASGIVNNKEYSSNIDTNKNCLNANNFKQCTTNDLWCTGIDPNCSIGPFCHDTEGWNSPVCTTMFYTGKKNNSCSDEIKNKMNLFSYCRIALNATEDAKNELQQAGYNFINGTSTDDTEGYKEFIDACNLVNNNWENGDNKYKCPPLSGGPQPSKPPTCE